MTTYYNGYLGLAVDVPKDWTVATRVEKNMTASPSASDELAELELEEYAEGVSGFRLIDIWSKKKDSDPAHAQLSVFCDMYAGGAVSAADYLVEFETVYAGAFPDGESGYYVSVFKSRKTVKLGGVAYERLTFETTHPDNDVPYIEEYHVRDMGEGCFAVVFVSYWEGNSESYDSAMYALETLVRFDA